MYVADQVHLSFWPMRQVFVVIALSIEWWRCIRISFEQRTEEIYEKSADGRGRRAGVRLCKYTAYFRL